MNVSEAENQRLLEEACKNYNIPEHLSQFEKERHLFAEIFRTYKIPESLCDKEKSAKYKFLADLIRPSLFRYRKIVSHNISALKGDYISLAKPYKMGSTGDECDSQIIIDYEKIQSQFSIYLSLDVSYWEKWAFNGKPFPEDKLRLMSPEMQSIFVEAQGFMKNNLQLKSQLKIAKNFVCKEVEKLTLSKGT